MRLHLASLSPARKETLERVGITPVLLPHEVDEQALVAEARDRGVSDPSEFVQMLAEAKARDACERADVTGLVLGGDSMFAVDGEVFGKPHTPDVARERWLRQRGQEGVLHSGHSLVHCVNGKIVASAGGSTATTVRFAKDLTDQEIDAYIATEEPLQVAGAFTIDAKGAGFIESIDGDPYTVVGLSVSKLRQLVRQLGFSFTDLWDS